MSSQVPDPVEINQSRVLVRQTASGFEQGIAALAGLLTAGPIGALASWGTIRGVQGKWTPWFILGIPSIVGINIINIILLGMIGAVVIPEFATPSDDEDSHSFNFHNSVNMIPIERMINSSQKSHT